MDIRPNHTIYINNLNEKIKKDGKFSGPQIKVCIWKLFFSYFSV